MLPFSGWRRAVCAFVLLVTVVATLWFAAFPAIEPHLPNYDGQVTDSTGTPADSGDQDAVVPSPS
jgi:hypothetical protein